MEISANMVKELREATGAGMMDCKKALIETSGDMQKAVDYLREKGLGKAEKKADRLASEGVVSVLVNEDGTIGTLVEVNSETDFVAKNSKFINFVDEVVSMIQANKPNNMEDVKNIKISETTFDEYLKTQIAVIGENLVLRRFENISGEVVGGYLHSNKRVAVVMSAKCNGANKDKVSQLLKGLCMHAAAMNPKVISYKQFDKEFVEKEFVALKAELEKDNEELKRLGKPLHNIPKFASRLQICDKVLKEVEDEIKKELAAEGKPEKIWDRIIPGKLDRFFADNTLLDQRLTLLGQFYVMDDKKTIQQVIDEKSKELGGNIELVSYVRYEVGEGLEKKNEDFAAEVAAQIG